MWLRRFSRWYFYNTTLNVPLEILWLVIFTEISAGKISDFSEKNLHRTGRRFFATLTPTIIKAFRVWWFKIWKERDFFQKAGDSSKPEVAITPHEPRPIGIHGAAQRFAITQKSFAKTNVRNFWYRSGWREIQTCRRQLCVNLPARNGHTRNTMENNVFQHCTLV